MLRRTRENGKEGVEVRRLLSHHNGASLVHIRHGSTVQMFPDVTLLSDIQAIGNPGWVTIPDWVPLTMYKVYIIVIIKLFFLSIAFLFLPWVMSPSQK